MNGRFRRLRRGPLTISGVPCGPYAAQEGHSSSAICSCSFTVSYKRIVSRGCLVDHSSQKLPQLGPGIESTFVFFVSSELLFHHGFVRATNDREQHWQLGRQGGGDMKEYVDFRAAVRREGQCCIHDGVSFVFQEVLLAGYDCL